MTNNQNQRKKYIENRLNGVMEIIKLVEDKLNIVNNKIKSKYIKRVLEILMCQLLELCSQREIFKKF